MLLSVLLLLSGNPIISSASSTSHNSVVLGTDVSFYSVTFNTYTSWSQPIYADSVYYSPSHINFTNAGFNNATSPAWTFGVSSQIVNVIISQIATNLIEIDDTSAPSSTAFVFFYYAGSSPVTKVGSTSSGSFLTSYSSFTSCSAPCVFLNQTGHYIEI